MKQIVVVNDRWSNIGDVFYTNSLINMLEKTYGDKARVLNGDGIPPIPLTGRFYKNIQNYNTVASYNPEWYVLSGPIFDKNFGKKWTPQLLALSKRGVKIVFMSIGSNDYDDEEIEIIRNELKKIKPYIFTTRDKETYDAYNDLATYSYNGICTAFFCSYHYGGINKVQLDQYCVISFDKSTEPKINIDLNLDKEPSISIDPHSVKKLNSKFQRFMDGYKKYDENINNINIVRTLQEPSSLITNELFRRPNRHISCNPYSYLDIFKDALFAVSDRVHVCVPTLSYGNEAMLIKQTKRSKLFDRVGLSNINNKLVSLSKESLDREYASYMKFLQEIEI